MALSAGVAIVGDGLIGSSAALAIADSGIDVIVIADTRPGAASGAAAGMLAPSIELALPQMRELATAARDMYPDFVAGLQEKTDVRIELNREGLLEIAADSAQAEELAVRTAASGTWLDSEQVAAVEPAIVAAHGAAFWRLDGAVDNTQLLSALQLALHAHPRITVCDAAAELVSPGASRASVLNSDGTRVDADRVVIAAGAWSGDLPGAPLAMAVEPVRGQLVEFERGPLTHVVYGPRCYMVPRRGRVIAGSTMERVGFDAATTAEAVAALTGAALALCPPLASGAEPRAWAGLRPVTPDLLPLLGPDPHHPALIYACGHSRNGVLLAPMTALLLKQLIFEEPLTFDISQFRPDRFADTFTLT